MDKIHARRLEQLKKGVAINRKDLKKIEEKTKRHEAALETLENTLDEKE